MHYSTGRDYVFPLVDAAYRTLVIFVYIVITLTLTESGRGVVLFMIQGCSC